MSNQTNAPRDIVEGGPERPPNGQDDSDDKRGAAQPAQPIGDPDDKRGAAQPAQPIGDPDDARKEAPRHRDDVTYQPESGQLGAD